MKLVLVVTSRSSGNDCLTFEIHLLGGFGVEDKGKYRLRLFTLSLSMLCSGILRWGEWNWSVNEGCKCR